MRKIFGQRWSKNSTQVRKKPTKDTRKLFDLNCAKNFRPKESEKTSIEDVRTNFDRCSKEFRPKKLKIELRNSRNISSLDFLLSYLGLLIVNQSNATFKDCFIKVTLLWHYFFKVTLFAEKFIKVTLFYF